MKRITYICDKCKKEFDRKNIVQLVVQKVNCGDDLQKNSNEFCVPCYDGLMHAYDTYMNFKDPVVEKTDTENKRDVVAEESGNVPIRKEQPTKKEGNETTAKEELKTGPMTPSEISTIMRMDAEGKSPEEIAKTIHRSVRGVNRSITVRKNKMAKEELSSIKESDLSECKKFDIPGIIALAKAGWTPRQIAGEHHCKVDEITEILSTYRKK